MGNAGKIGAALLVLATVVLAAMNPFACVAQTVTVPVPTSVFYPGDRISAEGLGQRTYAGGPGAFRAVFVDPGELAGKIARRTLLPGQPIPRDAVREPYAVTQGTSVIMVYNAGGLTITGYGVPLRSATVGELVDIRNPDSGAIVKGVVRGDGTVSVSIP